MTGQLAFALDHAAEIQRLVPLAQELAHQAGSQGITVANLRLAAVRRGYLTGEERQLSFLGQVMKAAGLRNTGIYRRSHIAKAHGNLNAVWVAAQEAA